MSLLQTALDQINRILRSPSLVCPIPIRRGTVILILPVCVDINGGGGFDVGHRELRSRREVRRKKRKGDGGSEMLLKITVLFYFTEVTFSKHSPRAHNNEWKLLAPLSRLHVKPLPVCTEL